MEDLNSSNLKLVTELRHELHRHPELSMNEVRTKQRLMDFLRIHTNLEIVDRGKWFYAVCRAGEDRPSIAFRADMDALPMDESTDLVPYASDVPGVSHKCGHDGHCAVMAGLAMELTQNGSDRNVYLLFQHAEETGQGAAECSSFLEECGIDEIYAFHNYAGYPRGWVVVRDGTMNCASKGLTIEMSGTPAHASMPENGVNPSYAMAEVICQLPELSDPKKYEGIILCTVVQVDIGQNAFGMAASKGVLRLTIRAQYEREMNALQKLIEQTVMEQSKKNGLTYYFEECDIFPETSNAAVCVEKIRQACQEINCPVIEMADPMRASEDFGHFLKRAPGAAFGIGIGENHPSQHTVDYDFPDEIIGTAVDVYRTIAALA